MFGDAVLRAGNEPDPATVRQLLDIFGLTSDPVAALRMRRMFRVQVQFGGAELGIESAQFLDRVRSSGHAIPGPAPAAEPVAAGGSEATPRYRWVLDYIPRVLPRGAEMTANVRFRNIGLTAWPHRPPHEIRLCARWYNEAGEEVEAPDVRTPLPLDIVPGREITVPMAIHTPRRAGQLQLQLTMVQEGIRFLHGDSKRIPVRLADVQSPGLPEGWVRHAGPQRSYADDHRRGRDMLEAWIDALGLARPRVLEVGGNASPMIAGLSEAELYNLDVDLLGLQVGDMAQRRAGRDFAFVCADAEDLPFRPGFFDAIVLFATLHHFPDPARLLHHLTTRLRPGGFIGVLCEPVGHTHPGAVELGFLTELRKGVNEQSFTAAEYAAIFRRARLRVAEAVVDVGSLKARLVPLD